MPPGQSRSVPFLMLAAAIAWCLMGWSADAAPEAARPKVELGIEGNFKVGSWTPVHVELATRLTADQVVMAIASDFENNLVETPLTRTARGAAGLIQIGRLDGVIRLELREAGKGTLLTEVRVSPTGPGDATSFRHHTEFWGILGSKGRFADAAQEWTDELRLLQGRTTPPAAIAIPLTWNRLPERDEAWEQLDVLVIGAEAFSATAAESERLRRWTERGGRVLFLYGAAAEAFPRSEIAKWSPIPVEGTVNATSLEMVNARVPGSASLRIGLRRSIPAARLPGTPEGTLPGPAVLSRPYGFGFVTAFAFDFEQPPLSTWENQTTLLRKLMMPPGPPLRRTTGESDLGSVGVTDLATQLNSGLDQFPNVKRVSFRGVLLWTILWMAVLFPFDYLLVHKLLKRPHLTWLTMPFLIAGATLLAARHATATNASPLTVNQVDLLDYAPARSTVRLRSWMTFYSGETARYDVAAKSSLGGPAEVGWNAKPEEGLRGVYRQGGTQFGAPSYQTTADHHEIQGLPVRLWSSYSLASEWSGEHGDAPPLFEASLTESDSGRLTGALKHSLPAPLHDWIIVYRNFVYAPFQQRGDLTAVEWPAGKEWRPDVNAQPTLVKVWLQGRREKIVKGQAKKDSSTNEQVVSEIEPYDSLQYDPNRLIRMLTFHDAAGGGDYTGLTNFPLRKLDVSRMFDTVSYKGIDAAILFGRIDVSLMGYDINGEPRKAVEPVTFVRAIFPVQNAGNGAGR